MTTLILGEDIDQWPFHAFFQLPLIPISLALGPVKRFRNPLPLAQLLTLWPSYPPNETLRRAPFEKISFSRWLKNTLGWGTWNKGLQTIPFIREPAVTHVIFLDTIRDFLFSWPPSPFVFSLGLTVVQKYYGLYMERYRRYVLGDGAGAENDDGGRRGRFGGVLQHIGFEIGIGNEDEEDEEDNTDDEDEDEQLRQGAAADRQHEGDEPENRDQQDARRDHLQDDNNVRLVLERVDVAPQQAPAEQVGQVEAPAQAEVDQAVVRQVNAAQNEQNAQNGRPDENAVNINGVRLRLTSTSALACAIGGALIVPPIASAAGNILLHLALGSLPHERLNPRMYGNSLTPRNLLRRFLAIRRPNAAPRLGVWDEYTLPDGNTAPFELIGCCVALGARSILVGTPIWRRSDPVWCVCFFACQTFFQGG